MVPAVHIQHPLHVGHKLRTGFERDHLTHLFSGFEFVYFHPRTDSCEISFTNASSTARSASKRSDQRAYPLCGAALE